MNFESPSLVLSSNNESRLSEPIATNIMQLEAQRKEKTSKIEITLL